MRSQALQAAVPSALPNQWFVCTAPQNCGVQHEGDENAEGPSEEGEPTKTCQPLWSATRRGRCDQASTLSVTTAPPPPPPIVRRRRCSSRTPRPPCPRSTPSWGRSRCSRSASRCSGRAPRS